jgi:hypothetical protein
MADNGTINSSPFSSTFKFEIHQQGYNYSVRTLFNNNVITFKDCSNVELCPVDIFYNILSKLIFMGESTVKA